MKKLAFDKIFKRLGIKKNDIIFLSTNLLKLSIKKKKKKIDFEIEDIVNGLIKIIKKMELLLFQFLIGIFVKEKVFIIKKLPRTPVL